MRTLPSLRVAQVAVFGFSSASALQYAACPSPSLGLLLVVLNIALVAALRRRPF